MKAVHISEIDNLYFWVNYFGCSYPNAYDEEDDVSVSELMYELSMEEDSSMEEVENWWEEFTGYYDGVLDESDGYLDSPTTLEVEIAPDKVLKIEFHPGDTLYFINNVKIGSTGPHWELGTIPYEEIRQLLALENGCQLYLLLLPLAVIKSGTELSVQYEIKEQMKHYFSEELSERVSGCIITGLEVSDK